MAELPKPRIAWADDEEDITAPFPKETDRRQADVLIEALEIFLERNAKRADLWKQFGWQDSALHLRSKALRVALALEKDLDIDPEDVLDDAIDIINYAVFFVRNVRGD